MNQRPRLIWILLGGSIIGSILTVAFAGMKLGIEYAILGAYAPIGIIIGSYIYLISDSKIFEMPSNNYSNTKLILLFLFLTVSGGIYTDSAAYILVGLIFCNLIFIINIRDCDYYSQLVVLCLIFISVPAIRYFNSGLFIGGGDLPRHISITNTIIAESHLIGLFNTPYQNFPVLHIINSLISISIGVSAYDSIALLGIIVSAITILYIFEISSLFLDAKKGGIYCAFLYTSMNQISFYASYFFPQSLATHMLVSMVVIFIFGFVFDDRRRIILSILILSVVVLTHHFTFIVVLPVIVFIMMLFAITKELNIGSRQAIWLMIITIPPVMYWLLVASEIIAAISLGLQHAVQSPEVSSPINSTNSISTNSISTNSISNSLRWLAGVYGVYYISLVAISTIGVATLIVSDFRGKVKRILIPLGILSTVFIVEIPIPIKSINRISFTWYFISPIAIGSGIFGILNYTEKYSLKHYGIIFLLLTASVTAPIATQYDTFDVNPRPTPLPTITDGQLEQLKATGEFTSRYSDSPATTLRTKKILATMGIQTETSIRYRADGYYSSDDIIIYNNYWQNNLNIYGKAEGSGLKFTITKQEYENSVSSNDKIYSSGNNQIVWADGDEILWE